MLCKIIYEIFWRVLCLMARNCYLDFWSNNLIQGRDLGILLALQYTAVLLYGIRNHLNVLFCWWNVH